MKTPEFNLDCLKSLMREDANLTLEQEVTLAGLRQWLDHLGYGEASEPWLPPYVLHLVSVYTANRMRKASMS